MKLNKFLLFLILILLGGSLGCAFASQVLFDEDETIPLEVATPSRSISPTVDPVEPPPPSAPQTEGCIGDDCAEACMGQLAQFLSNAGNPLSPMRGSLSARGSDDEEVILITYDITGDRIANGVPEDVPQNLREYRDNTSAHEQIWEYYAAIIPSEERTMLKSLVFFTDGVDNTLAWVDTSQKDDTKWDLGIDIRDTRDPRELTYTLIHEYAHLITLSDEQMPYSSRGCDTYSSDAFCAEPDSYINLFVERFWLGHLDEWYDINAITDDDEYYASLDDFYYANEDEFITDYAATSPEEDLAETWSFFILSAKPAGDTIAEQKVLFLYEFPELVALRGEIINGLCSYAGQ